MFRNNRLIFIPSSLSGQPLLEVVLLDNNLLTEIPDRLFTLPALRVLSYSGNLLLPQSLQTRPVFSPREEDIGQLIERLQATERPDCGKHKLDLRESLYQEIAEDDTNHIQPLKAFQSCSRCVSDILKKYEKYERSESNIKNERKNKVLQVEKEKFKLQCRENVKYSNRISKKIPPDFEKKGGKVSMEIVKISWELVKFSAKAFSCYYRLRSEWT